MYVENAMNNIEKFIREVQVYDLDLTKTRIGNDGDGGYIALREVCEKTQTVYSFGIGKDVSFELDFAERFPRAKIDLFDPFIEYVPKMHPSFTFFQEGIGNGFGEIKNVNEDSLLKMDIEWDEWDAFLKFDEIDLARFTQILVEFHIVGVDTSKKYTPYFIKFYHRIFWHITQSLFGQYYNVMKKLNVLFYCFHIHPNNSLPKVNVEGYWFPPLLELSFVRKDVVDKVWKTTTTFPIQGLDFPNKIDRPDIINFYPLGK